MLNIRSQDLIHKSIMNRLLMDIVDNPVMSQGLAFKGGTCASMLGYLDRFSVDLDFDVLNCDIQADLRNQFYKVFKNQALEVVKENKEALFFQVKYQNKGGTRNTLKVSATDVIFAGNQYKVQYLSEIDRLMKCQTVETMFANKLVAITDRYNLHRSIAGRDIYDIHYFFIHGYSYCLPVIQERTGIEAGEYFRKLTEFIKKHLTQTIVNEDLNTLLPPEQFQQIRKILIPETLSILEREIKRY